MLWLDSHLDVTMKVTRLILNIFVTRSHTSLVMLFRLTGVRRNILLQNSK